ncbi:hypothetical protein [Campylobacter sp. CCUG 57310]|uniref:hypothetical protein n=1 Tax=Campylobacter sp. CCUG 57310 TaxID=2517362 RepID=UPI0015632DB7|nr:hypothetical protein [Campylobacter sp. CCUG 57310]QKF93222.1 hypothetical protein CORI_a036 [Campylobacter sp. CCUG 57310]
MKNLIFITLFAFVLVGCSGKVQTNPLPSQTETKIPRNYQFKQSGEIDKELLEDFNDYAKMIFSDKNSNDESISVFKEQQKTEENYQEIINPSPTPVNLWQSGLDVANKAKK